MISKEAKEKAIRLYRIKNLTIPEISNLTGIATPTLTCIYKEAFKNSILKPRRECTALKNRTPNGQGKMWITVKGVGSGGRSKERKKYSPEEEKEIIRDYYERNLSVSELKAKWGIHPMQIQRMRNMFGHLYGKKPNKTSTPVLQFDTDGNFIGEFKNSVEASNQTGISNISIVNCYNGKQKTAGGFVWRRDSKKDDD